METQKKCTAKGIKDLNKIGCKYYCQKCELNKHEDFENTPETDNELTKMAKMLDKNQKKLTKLFELIK